MSGEEKFHGRYTEISHGIRISVRPEPIEDQSDPENSIYTFAYHITIENMGESPAKLLERHWFIYSGMEQIAEVVGPGVVGMQPLIRPAEAFQYESSAVIKDPIGSMHGTYTFRSEITGDLFEVTIPKFDLVYSQLMH